MKIPITKPFFDDREKAIIVKPLETGWVVQGPFVKAFEERFARFIHVPHALATTSCTTALHLALEALGIGHGHAVVLPSFTFVASANSVEYTGADVVFCDIDLDTFTMDCRLLEEILSGEGCERIKAVMPVHLFGLCADMKRVMKLSETRLKVVEDAACAFDSWIGSRHAGTFGDAGCFSFHPRKAITTGEGGMVVTSKSRLAAKLASMRDHGAGRSDLQRHLEKGGSLLPSYDMRGYNYRMTDFQGAIGVAQMDKSEQIAAGRRRVAALYDAELKGNAKLRTPVTPDGFTHSYQSYVTLFTGGEDLSALSKRGIDRLNRDRNRIMAYLEERGIATRQGTHAVHTLGYYRKRYNLRETDFLRSYAADRLTLALPLYPSMTMAEFDYVMENLTKALSI